MKRSLISLAVIVTLAAAFSIWVIVPRVRAIPDSPEQAFQLFLTREAAEDQIMNPLLLVGDGIIPLLVEAIPNQDMPRRRYAISALANLEAKSAIPILRRIAIDPSEEDYFQCDALNVVALISQEAGLELAEELRGNTSSCIAQTIEDLMTEDYAEWRENHYKKRSYFEALMDWHY